VATAPLAITRSLPTPAAIAAAVAHAYPIAEPRECVLWRSFTNDVYRLTTHTAVYFLKLYGPGWRSAAEILWEIELLQHLAARGVAVAPALPRRDGQPFHVLPVPEGPRYGVLFAQAAGAKPARPFTAALYHRFGRAAGALHLAADDFVSAQHRIPLDLTHLLDQPLAAIRPYLAHRQADWDYLTQLAAKIRTRLTALAAAGLDWGPCHGDLTLDSFHLTADDDIIFYDFDSGGPGWRALEFQGIYASAIQNQSDIWDAFVKGYNDVRALHAVDLAALPWCVPLYTVFDLGWAASQWVTWSGQCRLSDEYWGEQLRRLAQWEATQLR
jgi:Ser/Thr protein kinase RdoA (MazF antagonist)